MMFHTTTKWVEIFDVTIENIEGNFELKTQLNNVEKDTLLSLPNPNYLEIISHYPHLNDIKLNDIVKKKELPVHVILGVSDYAKIKMQERPRIGQPGDPIAELTRFGWFIMSPGHESNLTHLLFSNTSAQDYEKLCSLDVLGIEENHNFKDTEILDKFKKQLKQSDEGWYETGLIWKTDHPVLTNNKSNSLGRLNNLLKHLKKNSERFIAYDKVIQEQLEDRIIEKVLNITPQKGKEFYLPHKAIIREDAESTKLRVVYDVSSKPNMNKPSLNECLRKESPLQNMLWDNVVRNRMKPVALCADLRKAFLQIRIRECEKDNLKFHWIKNQNVSDTEILRFTRLVFGLIQSPFILEAILQSHLSKYEKNLSKRN